MPIIPQKKNGGTFSEWDLLTARWWQYLRHWMLLHGLKWDRLGGLSCDQASASFVQWRKMRQITKECKSPIIS